MQYADFITLGWDGGTNFISYFEWLLKDNFQQFEINLLKAVDMKKFQKRDEEEILLSSLVLSPTKYEKRLNQKQFYHCNAQCAHIVFKAIFNDKLYNALTDSKCIDAVRNNYKYIMRNLLLDIMDMENAYNCNINKDNSYPYNIGKLHQETMPFHQILRQNLFGQFSFHSFNDMETSYSISIIRQLIELRIRRAFGLLSVEDKNNTIIPISFSSIIEAIEASMSNITFAVNFKLIKNIYIWSNMYVHAGLKHFSWIPYSIERVLRPLTFGETNPDGSWSFDNGIKVKKEALTEIHKFILDCFNDSELKITKISIECELI